MNTFTEENYLKAIYKLCEYSDTPVNTNAIANSIKTKAATVTDMLKKLNEKKLINYVPYKGVTLTKQGNKIALDIIRKHRLWELFLVETLNFKWDEVDKIAEQLEHIKSDDLINRLDSFLGFPKKDPHGDPIPDKNGVIDSSQQIRLSEVKINKPCIMSGVIDHSGSFLRYLEEINLQLGQIIKVVKYFDYDGSIDLMLDSKNTIHISKQVAGNVLVTLHNRG
ncbi:MAG TPA: metal-dependent transcriptional regulator [Bacteroidia bacterium]|nr:metal-dependent transcriptional regulator [Bacteroidia bacterium]